MRDNWVSDEMMRMTIGRPSSHAVITGLTNDHMPRRHFLVITEVDGEREYEIEHDDCPTEEIASIPGLGFEGSYEIYTCAVGVLALESTDFKSEEWNLPPGRYEIEARHEYTPSTPNGPAEWDVWLEVVE